MKKLDSLYQYFEDIRVRDAESAFDVAVTAWENSLIMDHDWHQAKSLINLARAHYELDRKDSAIFLLKRAQSINPKDEHLQGLSYRYLGMVYMDLLDFKRASDFLQKALDLIDADDIAMRTNIIRNQGVIHAKQNDYLTALTFFTKAYEEKLANGLEEKLAPDLNNIGLVYRRLGEFDKALEFADKTLALDMKYGDVRNVSRVLINKAVVFDEMGNADSSLYYYHKGISVAEENQHFRNMALGYGNLADFHHSRGQFQKALDAYEKSYKIALSIEERSQLLTVIRGLSLTYEDMGRMDSALHFARESFAMAIKAGIKLRVQQQADMLSGLFEKKEVLDSALFYSRISQAYADSLYEENAQRRFANLRIRIETLEQEQEIDRLESQHRIDNLKIYWGSSIGIALIGIMGLIFYSYRARQLQKQTKMALDHERLTKEVDMQKHELSHHTLSMLNKNQILQDIEDEAKCGLANEERSNLSLSRIIKVIARSKSSDKDWDNFNHFFSQVHHDFFQSLSDQFPQLSTNEKRLSALLKLNLSNIEVSSILGIESNSVKMAKYRLKKKIGLAEEEKLEVFLQTLS
ncbi:MAG: tetratricopeptide repeat protein [Cyclobacteriaceae bacterium]|nr:tetratricopeptide repeat protein [Cyclobacteriaceae bacterium HetDA_MAG_MS6]